MTGRSAMTGEVFWVTVPPEGEVEVTTVYCTTGPARSCNRRSASYFNSEQVTDFREQLARSASPESESQLTNWVNSLLRGVSNLFSWNQTTLNGSNNSWQAFNTAYRDLRAGM